MLPITVTSRIGIHHAVITIHVTTSADNRERVVGGVGGGDSRQSNENVAMITTNTSKMLSAGLNRDILSL